MCKATRANGERCKALAGPTGLCSLHADPGRAKELGRLGGRGRTRSMLGITDEVADDKLRAKAKRRLEELLDSDDEGKRLAAARALYSYQAARPPAEEAEQAPTIPTRFLRELEKAELARLDVAGGVVTHYALLDLPDLRVQVDAAWEAAANAYGDARAAGVESRFSEWIEEAMAVVEQRR